MPDVQFPRRTLLAFAASIWTLPACSQVISKVDAVTLAEEFIARNGYTRLPPEQVSAILAPESLEWTNSREEQLKERFNTLEPKAIGIKKGARGQPGWSVAFDFAGSDKNSSSCRVVTMDAQGKSLVVRHQDGIRSYFAGFD